MKKSVYHAPRPWLERLLEVLKDSHFEDYDKAEIKALLELAIERTKPRGRILE